MSLKSVLITLLAFNWSIWQCFCKNDSNDQCFLPKDCRIGPIHYTRDFTNRQYLFRKIWDAIICKPRDQSFTIDSKRLISSFYNTSNYFKCFNHKYQVGKFLQMRLPSDRRLFLSIQSFDSIIKVMFGWNDYLIFLN